jgi:hypothetical protein
MAHWNPQTSEEIFQVKILIHADWELDRLAAAKLWDFPVPARNETDPNAPG